MIEVFNAFAFSMSRLGPFEPAPALAVAVSGGADSMAAALLAREWAAARGGRILALVVDHGLRAESTAEAELTGERLRRAGIPFRLLRVGSLQRGPALAERARAERYRVLAEACEQAGVLHLIVAHHAADQAETLAMRVLRGSRSTGLAGMAGLREVPSVRLLRPLLAVGPDQLRAFLNGRGVSWVEDPSNRDQRALRPRLRARMGPPNAALGRALTVMGRQRSEQEAQLAGVLAERVSIHPEGYAHLTPGRIDDAALRALIQAVSGGAYPVSPAQISELAAAPRPATLGGVRLVAAGRHGPGLLVVREEAAIAGHAMVGGTSLWDGRFRLIRHDAVCSAGPGSRAVMSYPGVIARPAYASRPPLCPDVTIGKLGGAAAAFRRHSGLPSVILRSLPALWRNGKLATIPHLGYVVEERIPIVVHYAPCLPLAGPDFVPGYASEL